MVKPYAERCTMSILTTPPADREMVRSANRGSRVYAIDGGEYPSVTSIISKGEPKPALIGWAKKVTAEAAIEQYELVGTLIEKDGNKAAIDHLKGAAYRQRDAAGELGSRLHEVAEYEVVQGKPYPEQGDPKAQMLLVQFRDFVKTTNPQWLAVEAIVYNETDGYAGTFDAAALIPQYDTPVLIDWKSGSGVYGSHALQIAAYAHAEYMLGPDGPEEWRGVVNTKVAVVAHIRPEGWRLIEVDIGREVYEAFLVAKKMAAWVDGLSRQVVGKALATGRHLGGASIKKTGKGHAPNPDTVVEFGARRRIKPPALSA